MPEWYLSPWHSWNATLAGELSQSPSVGTFAECFLKFLASALARNNGMWTTSVSHIVNSWLSALRCSFPDAVGELLG